MTTAHTSWTAAADDTSSPLPALAEPTAGGDIVGTEQRVDPGSRPHGAIEAVLGRRPH